ncbi:MAG: hypothetical protein R3E21_08365 [Caenibius sp.]
MADISTTTVAPGANTSNQLNSRFFNEALSVFMAARRDVIMCPPATDENDDKEWKSLVGVEDATQEYLMQHVAPDWAGVLAKLEVYHDNRENRLADEWMASIAADLMRLAGIETSPTFDPFIWIVLFERAGGKCSLLPAKDGTMRPMIGCAPENHGATDRIRNLKPHEQKAVGEWLMKRLDPRDFGGEA